MTTDPFIDAAVTVYALMHGLRAAVLWRSIGKKLYKLNRKL